MKMFDTYRWGNGSASGIVYSFLWGKIEVEYELSEDRSFNPCYLRQWGGDAVYLKSLSMFGRSLSLTIWPLS